MTNNFLYSLPIEDYSWPNALFWGNFKGHCKKATTGTFQNRVVHILIAAIELLPIVSQIASIFEKIIVTHFSKKEINPPPNFSKKREIKPQKELQKEKHINSPIHQNPNHLEDTSLEGDKLSVEEIEDNDEILADSEEEENGEHLLENSLYAKAKTLIDENKIEDLPKVGSGRDRVSLPNGLPVVLKNCGSSASSRYKKMKKARDLIKKNAYTCLSIPKARVYDDFIIESRLPIIINDPKQQMGFYLEHQKEMTHAVAEFTDFLCRAFFASELSSGSENHFVSLSKGFVGRYDKVVMFEENGKGKIGFTNLENFKIFSIRKPNPDGYVPQFLFINYVGDLEICLSACRLAMSLFPHHLDTIINTAKKYNADIDKHNDELNNERNSVLQYFQSVYQDHLQFIKQKNISNNNPAQFADVPQDRKQAIMEVVGAKIHQIHFDNKDVLSGCLGTKPKETLEEFKQKTLPEIVELTTKFLIVLLNANIENYKKKASLTTYPELLSARTLLFNHKEQKYENLKKEIASHLGMLQFNYDYNKIKFAARIVDEIFYEMKNGGEIACYDPVLDEGKFHCIFC